MKPHLQYLNYLIRHKWFVFRAGLATGAPLWRLVIHDWSKFSRAEWSPSVNKFYGNWGSAEGLADADEIKQRVDLAYNMAWLHHQHHNPHHWQHWVLREDDGDTILMPIPERFVREMVADWMGAGRAAMGRWEVVQWYHINYDSIWLEAETRKLVDQIIFNELPRRLVGAPHEIVRYPHA